MIFSLYFIVRIDSVQTSYNTVLYGIFIITTEKLSKK